VRAESVRHKFGDILRQKRCLIPGDGFYEWVTDGRKKLPHRFTLKSGEPFAFAGLWDTSHVIAGISFSLSYWPKSDLWNRMDRIFGAEWAVSLSFPLQIP
jgi:putative SOS response-associated peptidase YedK